MNFEQSLANYALGNVEDVELITIANNALSEGYDSEYLAILAGENWNTSNIFQIKDYFSKALKDLNVALPSENKAAYTIISYYLEKIISGKLSPQDGIKYIKSNVYDQINGFEKDKNNKYLGQCLELDHIFGLYYGYDNLQESIVEYEGYKITNEEAKEILNQKIIIEAKKYIREKNVRVNSSQY